MMKCIRLLSLIVLSSLLFACTPRFNYDEPTINNGNNAQKEEQITYEVGDEILFGSYELDGDSNNGAEDIEWLVLKVDGDYAFCISKLAIDCLPFNDIKESMTWEKSSIRNWLNNYFFESSFSAEEKSKIQKIKVVDTQNYKYLDIKKGNDTYDKVFLLSLDEVNELLPTDEERRCVPSVTAINNNVYVNDNNNCWWWLRTRGAEEEAIACIFHDGSLYPYGTYVDFGRFGIRPCIWIKLK